MPPAVRRFLAGSRRSRFHEQRQKPGLERETEFPEGAIGTLRPPEVQVDEELSREVKLLHDWKAGRIGTLELASRLETLKAKTTETSSPRT